MAALSGERSCQDGRRAKKAGLAISGLREVRGSLSKIIDSPSAFLAGVSPAFFFGIHRQPLIPRQLSFYIVCGRGARAPSVLHSPFALPFTIYHLQFTSFVCAKH